MSTADIPDITVAVNPNQTGLVTAAATMAVKTAAAGTSGAAKPNGATGWGETRDFLSNVVPWPGDQTPGYVNLHYSMLNKNGGKDFVTGRPFDNIDQFINYTQWALTTPNFKEMWYCTSLQRKAGTTQAGKPKALRNHANALKLKALWIDIDIKDDPKHYKTLEEALAAFTAFKKATGLPAPSAIVKSGGGLHIYWFSDQPLSPEEWALYAHGLRALLLKHEIKCDAGLTTDNVRLLRVPGTLNYKYDPPRRVSLFPQVPPTKYDFASTLSFLKGLAPKITAAVKSSFELPDAFKDKKPILSAPDKLSDGIAKYDDMPLLKVEPIARGCEFIKQALITGGKDYSQPMWNLTTLAATFMEDGHALAHRMGREHSEYTRESTDALWSRKLKERTDRGLGWPSCKTIQANGCGACATCPHFVAGKSPLHLGLPRSPGSTSAKQVANPDVKFRDVDKFGNKKPTLANAVIAIRALGVEARYDLFHRRVNVTYNGQSKTIHEGLLTDHTVSAVRSLINNTFLIDCGDANTLAAINEIAWDNAYDPVLDFLDDCQGKWDGIKRLDKWVVDYLGCEDTPLNRAIGRKSLISACRRARVPGCKHDEITVLEGPEGIQKSTAVRILAGDENFNDQSILGSSDKEVQEQLEGTWMHENSDLAGMRKAEVESVKAFARRQVDRARPAYGRVREDRPRRSIEWGTTNNKTYLQSQTGNRCFWPLECGTIDIEALRRDREQLIGEAATYEAAGESIALDKSLWGDAREAQEKRRIADPWEDILSSMPKSVPEYLGAKSVPIIHISGDGYERVASADVLLHVLKIPAAQQHSGHGQRLSLVMANIGWERKKSGLITIDGRSVRGYIRRDSTLRASPPPKDHTDVPREAAAPQDEKASPPISPTAVPVKEKTKKRPARENVRHKYWLCRR